MSRKITGCALAAIILVTSPANAEDDPNAAITAQTAQINAQTARINAEAALTTAKAARDKAGIEALGLPKFDNKTELVEKGGAIETAMLASRAVSAAAFAIKSDANITCTSLESPIVVLAGNEAFDLNSVSIMLARIDYHTEVLQHSLPGSGKHSWTKFMDPGTLFGLASAAAGLFGNDTKVTGVDLPELNDALLANAVAGQFKKCAVFPSSGGGIANVANSAIAAKLTGLVKLRNRAAAALAQIPAKASLAQKADAAQLTAAINEFDLFYKAINTPEADGKSALIRAVLIESVISKTEPKLLRVTVNRSGGTITNTKNIFSLLGMDPVRVSGGLIASYALVDANTGAVITAGTMACQTAQAKLRNVQSGNWYAYDAAGAKQKKAEAFCQ